MRGQPAETMNGASLLYFTRHKSHSNKNKEPLNPTKNQVVTALSLLLVRQPVASPPFEDQLTCNPWSLNWQDLRTTRLNIDRHLTRKAELIEKKRGGGDRAREGGGGTAGERVRE